MNGIRIVILLALLVVPLAYMAFLAPALSGGSGPAVGATLLSRLLIALALMLGALVTGFLSYYHVRRLFVRYSADFHDLTDEDAEKLTTRLLFGPRLLPPKYPILRIQSGRVDPKGPPVIIKVGGPASLSIDQGNAVITSRFGRLHRVLGPGFHDLGAFERVWDVLDLRPQRRTLTVEFMTRDSIPALCQVSLVCHADVPRDFKPVGPGPAAAGSVEAQARQAVLRLTSNKYVLRLKGPNRVSDWVIGIANGALDGIVRDELEQYKLDQLIDPHRWLKNSSAQPKGGSQPTLPFQTLPEVEARIRAELDQVAAARGIIIDSVELNGVQPAEESIAHDWAAFWQANLQQGIDENAIRVEVGQVQMLSEERVRTQALFVDKVMTKISKLQSKGGSYTEAMVVESVLEVLASMYAWEPDVDRSLLKHGESLVRFVDTILYGPNVYMMGGPATPGAGPTPGTPPTPGGGPAPGTQPTPGTGPATGPGPRPGTTPTSGTPNPNPTSGAPTATAPSPRKRP